MLTELEKLRIKPPWSKMNPVARGPRWVVVVVDNVAAGWAKELPETAEAFLSTYVFDAWQVYRACSPERLFQLYDVDNTLWHKEGTPSYVIDSLDLDYCTRHEDHNPLVRVSDIELDAGIWVVVQTYDLDGEYALPGDAGYMKDVDAIREVIRGNPPV